MEVVRKRAASEKFPTGSTLCTSRSCTVDHPKGDNRNRPTVCVNLLCPVSTSSERRFPADLSETSSERC